MDKRRNHIIFWVGYVLVFNFLFYFTVLSENQRKSLSIFLEFNTNSVAHIFIFYYLILKIFPNTLTLKKYSLSVIYTLFLLVFVTLVLLLVREFVLNDEHFKTFKIFIKSFTDVLNNTQNTLFLAILYWFLKQYINNEIEKRKVVYKKNTLIGENLKSNLLELKGQINPHFLYNTLNLFYAQSIPFSKKLSDGIMALSEIMRYTIDRNEEYKVPLEGEIKHLKNYFKICSLTSKNEIIINFSINGNTSYSRVYPSILLPLIDSVIQKMSNQMLLEPIKIAINVEKNLLFLLIKIDKLITHPLDLIDIHKKLYYSYPNKYILEEIFSNSYTLNLKIEL